MQDTAELPEIRAFVALADTGSFAAASRMLQRDATVLSRRLQALEARLGVRLAERTTRRVTVTEAGRAYLERVRPLLQDLEAADREAASFVSGEPRGRLKVALPHGVARGWLSPVLAGFAHAHERVRLQIEILPRSVDVIGEGFDLAMTYGDPRDLRLIARKIGQRRRLLCGSPDYLARYGAPEAPEDVMAHRCLCFTGEPQAARWAFRRPDGRAIAITAKLHMTSSDPELLTDAAIAGVGLYYTTDWLVGPELASGRLVEVLPEWVLNEDGSIYSTISADGGTTATVRAIDDWLAKAIDARPWLRRLGGYSSDVSVSA